jgi:HPt (histidine-containing phosphotransfer) domain-containing protein
VRQGLMAVVAERTSERSVAMVDRPPVDLVHLRRFTMGNRALEQEVLQLFAAQAPLTLEQLRAAASIKAWRDAAHTLKGSAAAVGATAIARTAAEAEGHADNPAAWPALVERLRLVVCEACAFIANAAPVDA